MAGTTVIHNEVVKRLSGQYNEVEKRCQDNIMRL